MAANEFLFIHYKCPQEAKYAYVYNHFSQIVFTLQGTKNFHLGTQSWSMTVETTHFAKKGAWKQENSDFQWELLAFYFLVEFLCNFYKEGLPLLPLSNLPTPPSDTIICIQVNESTRAFFYLKNR